MYNKNFTTAVAIVASKYSTVNTCLLFITYYITSEGKFINLHEDSTCSADASWTYFCACHLVSMYTINRSYKYYLHAVNSRPNKDSFIISYVYYNTLQELPNYVGMFVVLP